MIRSHFWHSFLGHPLMALCHLFGAIKLGNAIHDRVLVEPFPESLVVVADAQRDEFIRQWREAGLRCDIIVTDGSGAPLSTSLPGLTRQSMERTDTMKAWKPLGNHGPTMRRRFAWKPVHLWRIGPRYRELTGRRVWLGYVVETHGLDGEWVAYEHNLCAMPPELTP